MFWRLIGSEDKRLFTTFAVGVTGAGLGWVADGGLGVLTGLFLGACVGEIGGLARWGYAARSPEKKSGKSLQG